MKKQQIVGLLLSVILLISTVFPATFATAATFEDINDPSVFLKQETSITCTLSSAAMMVRRAAILTGNENWRSITESSMHSTAWLEGQGLYYSFTYAGISVKHSYLPGGESNKEVLISLLYEHPEGIILYYTGRPHAVLLTDYTNGVFYCADPANGSPAGRINIDSALAVTITNSTEYWYVSDPDCGIAPSFLLDPVVFNLDYYKSSYTDLREAFGDNDAAYINHWVTDGAKNGRCASPCFYSAWYLNYYQDIESVVGVGNYIGAIEHFVKNGISEGRMGSSEFYVGVYRENFLDLQQAFGNDNYPYFIHYINSGQKEGRLANERMKAFFDPNGGSCSIESMPITSVANYGMLPVATKAGCTFLGWYTLREGGEHITADSQVRVVTHQTLYAHWANDCSNGHSYTFKVTTTPTTSAAGVLTGTCSRCTSTTTVTLPKLNTTDYTYTVTKAASCTTTGTGRYTWKTTAYGTFYFDVTIAKTAHSYTATVTSPTCTEKGYTTYTCACGDSYVTDYAGALGHNFVGGVCTRCGEDDPNYNPPTPTDPCEGYTDINRSKWYHEAADFVIEKDYMGSTTTEALTFEPMTKVSRAMVASILYRIAGEGEVLDYQGTFTDVPAGKWYTTAIEWCAQNGLASGKGDGKFDPNGNVTRQELAVFMYKLAEFQGKDVTGRADLGSFADASSVPAWSKDYLAWAVDAGIISGQAENGKTYLNPTAGAMRCELASILMRFFA